jgi:hypothetical protein
MVRTKTATSTKGSRQQAGCESGDGHAIAAASATENLHPKRQSTFATVAEDALLGNVPSIRFWIELADGTEQPMESATPKSRFSQAIAWAAEPEWEGEASEELAETATGGWEPED